MTGLAAAQALYDVTVMAGDDAPQSRVVGATAGIAPGLSELFEAIYPAGAGPGRATLQSRSLDDGTLVLIHNAPIAHGLLVHIVTLAPDPWGCGPAACWSRIAWRTALRHNERAMLDRGGRLDLPTLSVEATAETVTTVPDRARHLAALALARWLDPEGQPPVTVEAPDTRAAVVLLRQTQVLLPARIACALSWSTGDALADIRALPLGEAMAKKHEPPALTAHLLDRIDPATAETFWRDLDRVDALVDPRQLRVEAALRVLEQTGARLDDQVLERHLDDLFADPPSESALARATRLLARADDDLGAGQPDRARAILAAAARVARWSGRSDPIQTDQAFAQAVQHGPLAFLDGRLTMEGLDETLQRLRAVDAALPKRMARYLRKRETKLVRWAIERAPEGVRRLSALYRRLDTADGGTQLLEPAVMAALQKAVFAPGVANPDRAGTAVIASALAKAGHPPAPLFEAARARFEDRDAFRDYAATLAALLLKHQRPAPGPALARMVLDWCGDDPDGVVRGEVLVRAVDTAAGDPWAFAETLRVVAEDRPGLVAAQVFDRLTARQKGAAFVMGMLGDPLIDHLRRSGQPLSAETSLSLDRTLGAGDAPPKALVERLSALRAARLTRGPMLNLDLCMLAVTPPALNSTTARTLAALRGQASPAVVAATLPPMAARSLAACDTMPKLRDRLAFWRGVGFDPAMCEAMAAPLRDAMRAGIEDRYHDQEEVVALLRAHGGPGHQETGLVRDALIEMAVTLDENRWAALRQAILKAPDFTTGEDLCRAVATKRKAATGTRRLFGIPVPGQGRGGA